jgi:hypothetical protein
VTHNLLNYVSQFDGELLSKLTSGTISILGNPKQIDTYFLTVPQLLFGTIIY